MPNPVTVFITKNNIQFEIVRVSPSDVSLEAFPTFEGDGKALFNGVDLRAFCEALLLAMSEPYEAKTLDPK